MKFLHLSDLHLGKRVNEYSMIEDQEYILTRIINVIDEEKPDGILIAGDIYDKSIPSEDAMKLWDGFLLKISTRKIPIFAISGNHDSAVRFADHSKFLEGCGVYLSPVYTGDVTPISLEDDYGEVQIFLLPFIKPVMVRQLFEEECIENYTDACQVAISHMNIDESKRNIILAHQFVTGATRCESEDINVGGLDQVSADVFDGFDYVALGHIHGKQSIKRPEVRYCGTPLKYSFSEKDHVKSVTVVELLEKGKVEIREKELIPLRDVREIKGSYEELTAKENYENTNTKDYLHVILTDEDEVLDAVGKLKIIYPNIMKLSYDNTRTRENQGVGEVEDIEEKTPFQLFADFFEKQNNQPFSEEQTSFVKECIEKIWGGDSK